MSTEDINVWSTEKDTLYPSIQSTSKSSYILVPSELNSGSLSFGSSRIHNGPMGPLIFRAKTIMYVKP